MDAPASGQIRLADYRPSSFLIDRVHLAFELDAQRTRVTSKLEMRRRPGAARESLRLDGERLDLISVVLDGRKLEPQEYVLDPQSLTIAELPDSFLLEIETEMSPAANKSGRGLFEIGGKLSTQCEAVGFRRITYFLDRPDILAVYTVRLLADRSRYPVLLSNGNLVAAGEDADGWHWVEWHDPFPKPSYIFAVCAGDFGVLADSFTTMSGRTIRLFIYSDRELIEKCRFAMSALKRSLSWDEETFGLEYDLDTFHLVALSGWAGAMENKGLNIIEAHGVVADRQITTDDDYILIERIIGHEQFHNWTGNRVTCRDWFQLSLKEGLTRYRDQLFMESTLGTGAWRIEMVKALRRNQFPEDDGPAAHPVKPDVYTAIDNFYTGTVYEKGAEVIRMMATLLGREVFRAGFDLYIERHDGQAVTTEDFVQAMEDASGRDLSQFRRWYQQAGRPRIQASGRYDADRSRYTLTLRQSCRTVHDRAPAEPFHIPVRVGLVSSEGRALSFRLANDGAASTMTDVVLNLTEVEQIFVFENVSVRPIPSLLRGFSAPVTVISDLTQDDLATLLAVDPDPFARWDAGQTLFIGLIRTLAAKRAAGQEMALPAAVVDAFARILSDEDADPFLKSQLLTIPDEPVLSEGLDLIDLDGHMAARTFVRHALATALKVQLIDRYRSLAAAGPYEQDFPAIGRRKFRNACLELLTALGAPDVLDLCLGQLKNADNMTDMFEALCYLSHIDCPQRREAIAWFYEKWKDAPTVIDKWFNAQALSRMPGVIDEIVALESHPAFDLNNMARAMLFYGGFFRQNRVMFHDPSGKGYDFLADRLIMMDKLGRQGSFWIMPQINQWRRYDPHRRQLMKQALERVAGTPGISNGLRESINNALN